MKKFLLFILIVSVVVSSLYFLKERNKSITESKYQTVSALIKQEKWNEASVILDEISYYKDVNSLKELVDGKKAEWEEQEFKRKQEHQIENAFAKIVALIKSKKYDEAGQELLNKDDMYMKMTDIPHEKREEIYNTILFYTSALIDYSKGNIIRAKDSLVYISPDYDDLLGTEIQGFANQIIDMSEWSERYWAIQKISTPPAIGMTAEEVRSSNWGEPKDINRTTATYGVHEQWVYSADRYIYFEDGVVTAIQD